jgi:predicted dehydrogenase
MKFDDLTGLIVGGGSIGKRHTRNLIDLGVETALCDISEDVREEMANEFGVRTYTEIVNAVDTEEPDFAVIGTPNRYHINTAITIAKRGCHLFVEKPLSNDTHGLDELETIITEQDLVTLVGCNLRFHPEVRKVKELVHEGVIGEIVAARIEGGSYLPGWFPNQDYRETYSAREDLGGGVILDYIHEINYARWMFDDFESVTAMTGQLSNLEIETNDVAAIVAQTDDGTICEFHLDYVQRPYSRSCHIVGEKGTIRWSWSDGKVRWHIANREESFRYSRPDDWTDNQMYVDEMRHFLECLESGGETTCPVSGGRRDLDVALAARESSERGKHVTLKH